MFRPVFFLLLAVAACTPSYSTAVVLQQSYRDIQQDYVQPMPARMQAMASLHQLSAIDDGLRVVAGDREIVMTYQGRLLRWFAAPPETDWRRWGLTVAEGTEAAAGVSPLIAAMAGEVLDAALIKGTLTLLDRYSYYVPPRLRAPAPTAMQHAMPAAPLVVSASAISSASEAARVPEDNGIALVRIEQFGPRSAEMVREDLAAFASRRPLLGVILDMRGDPGGDLDEAVEVVRLFLPYGLVVALEARSPAEREIIFARGVDFASHLPLLVLIDGESASAAEIVAAALQGNGRALVVGSPSFGKGTVQTRFRLANGGELWVTSAFSRVPAGYLLEKRGVIPDVCASLADAAGSRPARRYQWLLARPRPSLTESEWTELRQLCPSVSPSVGGDDPILQMALILLRDGRPQVALPQQDRLN